MLKLILVVLVVAPFLSSLEGADPDGGTKHVWRRENNNRAPRKELCRQLRTSLYTALFCENVKEEEKVKCGQTPSPSKDDCVNLGCCYDDRSDVVVQCFHPSLKDQEKPTRNKKVRNLQAKLQKLCINFANRKYKPQNKNK